MAGCLKLQKEQPQVLQDRVNGWKLSKLMQKQSAKAQYNIRYMYKATAGWNGSGTAAGTSGKAKRLEAIRIRLTGEMANKFDVYYRVHAQSYGWLDWAKNGEGAGTQGKAKRLEAIQIVIIPKGEHAPNPLPAVPGAAAYVH